MLRRRRFAYVRLGRVAEERLWIQTQQLNGCLGLIEGAVVAQKCITAPVRSGGHKDRFAVSRRAVAFSSAARSITSGSGGFAAGINNFLGTINGGAGNDYISGAGGNYAIFNEGTIDGGEGNDVVDALTGGFTGNGTADLGDGNEWLKGFGSGTFIGGANRRGPGDALTFNAGAYSIENNGDGTYTIGGVMNVSGFEFFAIPTPNQADIPLSPNAPPFAGCQLVNFNAAARAGTVTFT